MQSRFRFRLDAWIPTALLVTGTIAFINGGRFHPRVNAMTMPDSGTPEYYRHFADMMLSMPNWQYVHTLILAGPVLWALGTAGSVRLFSERVRAIADIARSALLGGALLWALAFVLDGYVGPRYAEAVVAAGPGADAAAIAVFGANAFTMARIGSVSIVLIAASVLAFAVCLLLDARLKSWRAFVGAIGLAVGGWPLIATAQGEFDPGPFVSVHWTVTAVSLGAWFLLFASTLPGFARDQAAPAIVSL